VARPSFPPFHGIPSPHSLNQPASSLN
jgi:hypothetical protein